jgi:hypothetical protein
MDFSLKNIRFNILATKYWHENVKCYELHKIMRQIDVHFINILVRFQTVSRTNENIHFMNNFCLRSPLMDNTLPHLFYTNLRTIAHNEIIYDKTPSGTFKFFEKDIHFEICPSPFKLLMLPSHTNGLHYELLF